MNSKIVKGQGAVENVHNHFEKNAYERTIYEDELLSEDGEIEESIAKTEYLEVFPKTIMNDVRRKGLPLEFSMNPYQGCEHGCAYCYARPTHEYWGYSAGIDFERKILVKKNAPELLEKHFQKRGYQPHTFMLSGNTDCYQPVERKLEITRKILQVCLDYRHPVGIITKNALVLRDLDILKKLAEKHLVNVAVSIPTINEDLRKKLEPRTSTVRNKLKIIETLSENNIPNFTMIAPVIPGLNSMEILQIIKTVSEKGTDDFGYTLVRLNDTVEPVFSEWAHEHFPDRAEKILNQIKSMHGGKLGERLAMKRNVGEGNIADMIHQSFKIGRQKYFSQKPKRERLATHHFNGKKGDQLSLF
jgi:DNA repair photolyase